MIEDTTAIGSVPRCSHAGSLHASPSTRSRKVEIPYDKALYRERHRIENTLGRLKDWRRVATRYDRCAHTFFSAIRVAATLTFWLS